MKNMEHFLELLENLKVHPQSAFSEFLAEIKRISRSKGIQAAYNSLLQAEVYLNLRKPKLGIYDHAFHCIGGAQKYGLSMISALQNQFDITIISNKEVNHSHFMRWYNLDLSHCEIKIIKLPFYEQKSAHHLDPACISKDEENPFHLISKESGNYDIFVNNSMNEMVYPLSNISVLVCHFPERRPKTYFYADQYTHIIHNSLYTAEWIKKKWDLTPHEHIYPPVDMEPGIQKMQKKKTIISVARFEVEGTKRQHEMMETFLKLKHDHPKATEDWTFKLIGGSDAKNPYLQRLKKIAAQTSGKNIHLKVNIPLEELKSLYKESTLFWHLCGLSHSDPSEIEHFGMTAVEAMQNKVVPVVYDGGGLREIVDHGINGFRVKSQAELSYYSLELFQDEGLVQSMGENAQKKSQEFSRFKFEERIHAFFSRLLSSYGRL
ncbi:MAG: glycosyltransferase family 4 protein [Candidatus Aminicenantes bacterium]|nr:MAG: glycosyltransferase family 4 protein [Candidatus Aminicenantes bacterium]